MRVSFAAFFVALVAPLMVLAAPSSSDIPQLQVANVELDLPVTHSNITERTYYYTTRWTDLKCDQISGTFRSGLWSVYFNFGCICYGDIDNFCYRNGYSSYVNSWIRAKFAALGTQTYRYPTGSQPTCNDRGGYICPYGTKADGTCSEKAVQCGDGYCLQTDGYCCPRGTKSFGGTCCALTCSGASNGKCYGAATCSDGKVLSNEMCCTSGWTGYKTVCCPSGQMEDSANPGKCICSDTTKVLTNGVCTSRCPAGQTWMGNTKCCPSYQTLVGGVCACADATMVDDPVNKCCKARCTTQQNWDAGSQKCVPKCTTGFTWSFSSTNPTGLCCTSGTTCRTKVCCKPEEEEMGPGKCCPKGNTWNYTQNKCQGPSGVPVAPPKVRRSKLPARKLNLDDKARLRLDEKLCPKDFSACPIDKSGSDSYECLDSFTDITSCGGCASVGEGQDCTAIKGAKWMGCDAGACVVYSCRKGFKLVDGKTCVKA